MILSIASGKGGTGKTTVAVNIALSLEDVQLLDCDVEEPNVYLLLQPKINETKPVYISNPQVDEEASFKAKPEGCRSFFLLDQGFQPG